MPPDKPGSVDNKGLNGIGKTDDQFKDKNYAGHFYTILDNPEKFKGSIFFTMFVYFRRFRIQSFLILIDNSFLTYRVARCNPLNFRLSRQISRFVFYYRSDGVLSVSNATE